MKRRVCGKARTAIYLGAALALSAGPAHAQIRFGVPGESIPADSTNVCRGTNGEIFSGLPGDCDGYLPAQSNAVLIVGPDGSFIRFDGSNGNAEFNGVTDLNGQTNINGPLSLNGGSLTANGVTSTGGLTNTGGFMNNGNANVTGVLSAGSLNTGTGLITGGSANLSGTVTVGSLVSNGQVRGTSLFTNGGATVQGFFNAQNGASILGNTQLATVQVFQSLAVSNGATINAGNNRVQNVATPTLATDAANKGYVDGAVAMAQTNLDAAVARQNMQGTSTAANFGGGSTYNPATGQVSAPTYTVGTITYNNVGAALDAANTTGIGNFHATTTKADSSATGANSVAIGGGSTASGASAFAAGDGAVASAAGAIAVGQGAAATGTNAVAIGTGAVATGSVAVGVGASAANGGAAFGDRAVATGTGSAALGADASATAANAVAIGGGSVATVANTVSVGTAASTRRVVNVAAGTTPSDVATVGQLAAGTASVASALGGGSMARADGTISAPSYAFGGNTYGSVGAAVTGLAGLSYDIRREARRGIAAATAMANAPMPSAPGRTSWAFNGATFHGEVAVGGSFAHRFNTGDPLAATIGFAYAKGGNNTVKAGMSGEF